LLSTIDSLAGAEVLLFFADVSSAVPLGGYQVRVVQQGGINNALLQHPNLLIAFDLSLPNRGEAAVLKTVFSAEQLAQA
jgi:hypothetical protein